MLTKTSGKVEKLTDEKKEFNLDFNLNKLHDLY